MTNVTLRHDPVRDIVEIEAKLEEAMLNEIRRVMTENRCLRSSLTYEREKRRQVFAARHRKVQQ